MQKLPKTGQASMQIKSYVFTFFVIGRPNEYRLFGPFLPLVLWLLQEQEATKVASD